MPGSVTFDPAGFAAAKINLCLHVTGRRADGYHLLDSVAVFAAIGDQLHAHTAPALSLHIEGPFADGLTTGPDNLVLRAAHLLATRLQQPPAAHPPAAHPSAAHPPAAHIVLHKHLPVASGIGGGSADAAATLRLLSTLWNAPPAIRAALPELARTLGADVPVCLHQQPARMRGIGEQLDTLAMPDCALVLVNPGLSVATATVFQALAATGHPASAPLAPAPWPHTASPDAAWPDAASLATWLHGTRNDLQRPAITLCPPIADVLAAIAATQGCLLARMSGSGATCFGLYATIPDALAAQAALARPGWWCWGGPLLAPG